MPLLTDPDDLLIPVETRYPHFDADCACRECTMRRAAHARSGDDCLSRADMLAEISAHRAVVASYLAVLEDAQREAFHRDLDRDVARHRAWHLAIERAVHEAGGALLAEQRRNLVAAGVIAPDDAPATE